MSNNPKVEVAEEAKKSKEEQDAFDKEVDQRIQETKELLDSLDAKARETEELKLVSMYNVGNTIQELVKDKPDKVMKDVISKFAAKTGRSAATFYISANIADKFTPEQLEQAKNNGMTLKVAAALVSIENDKTREELFRRAVEEGLTEDEIRTIKGTKGSRSAATRKNRREKDAKKPPYRVFVKAIDVFTRARDTMDSCSDAVNRMADCSDEDRKEATKMLLQVRQVLEELSTESKAFMKYTDSFEGKKKRAGSK